MAHFDTDIEAVGKGSLKLMFPKSSTITVTRGPGRGNVLSL